MKHFLLKFNHGVEIGAYHAYMGHYKRTKDPQLLMIAMDETIHRSMLLNILQHLNDRPSKVINLFFFTIGTVIQKLCMICPLWSLNFIARGLELFAVISYNDLAKRYPEYKEGLLVMAEAEAKHAEYFK